MSSSQQLADFDFTLPNELIAQYPLEQRGKSRLLCLNGADGAVQDCLFQNLPNILRPKDLLVLNNTRVLRARLYGRKTTGGKVEILIERLETPYQALAQIRANKPCKPGSRIIVHDTIDLEILAKLGDLVRLQALIPFSAIMEQYGHIPLPPYISRDPEHLDETRYQTIYAERDGAVAAPTAGLHFDVTMLAQLIKRGIGLANITLHVGAGTFQPVRAERLEDHVMHSEWCEVSVDVCQQIQATKAQGGRIVAVGTTSVRSLESAAAAGTLQPYTGETRLFIRPGYQFKVVDALITNFHLPRSTLLMLVCAFSGQDAVLKAYNHAVANNYRFFSYGDAMLLTRDNNNN